MSVSMKSAVSQSVVSRRPMSVRASMKPATVRAAPIAAPKADSMMVWQPMNNKQYECFSYLPPLTSDQIAKQVNYIISNGWTPCLEFADPANSFTSNANTVRFGAVSAGYYDNRYWTMFKLPMFGCTDPSQVLKEVANCQRSFPKAYIRLVAFDNLKQVQCMGFLVQRPSAAMEYCPLPQRSVA
jgi:ribulose-bisphosphate carboxylase small chain